MRQTLRFSLSSEVCGQLPCKEAFAEAADAGYKGYHLVLSPEKMATVETELADAKRASEEIGLGISSVEWRRQTESSTGLHEELEAAIEAAAALGAPRLVIGASSRPVNPSEMAMSIQKEADIFSEVLDSDKAQNIEVCIRMKPHTLAHDHYSTVGLLQLIAQFSARLIMDPVELCLGGADYSVTALRAVQDRLGIFVLRGVKHTAGGFEDVPLSRTTLYLQEHLARLVETKFQGVLLLGTHLRVAGRSVRDVIRDELRSAAEFLREIGTSSS